MSVHSCAPDPDLQPYAALHGSKQALHPDAGPCFICEGRYLVEEALQAEASGILRILSILATPEAASEWVSRLPAGARLLTLEKARMEALLGFQFHRGILCCVAQPPAPPEASLISAPHLLVLPRLDNVDNLGQLLRTAAALGMDAILAGQGPGVYERRTIRVSMGAAWKLPVLQVEDPAPLLHRWQTAKPEISTEIIGAALVPDAIPPARWEPAPRTALVLGPEATGLDPAWLARCDRHVCIPMARGMDSLNVAAAGAILMHNLIHPNP